MTIKQPRDSGELKALLAPYLRRTLYNLHKSEIQALAEEAQFTLVMDGYTVGLAAIHDILLAEATRLSNDHHNPL